MLFFFIAGDVKREESGGAEGPLATRVPVDREKHICFSVLLFY